MQVSWPVIMWSSSHGWCIALSGGHCVESRLISIWKNFVLTKILAQDAWIRRECNIWVAGQRPPPSQTTKRILANLDHTAGRGYIHCTIYILILLYNHFPKNILFQALVLEMKPASKNATSLLSGNTLLDADTKKMLCFLAHWVNNSYKVSIIKRKLDQKF